MQEKDLSITAASLQSKIEKLILLHRKALEDVQMLGNENLLLMEKLETQEGLLKDLTAELSSRSSKEVEIPEGKYLVSEEDLKKMVRDIDRCIALLSEKTQV
jgi:hypothetical protein